MSDQDSEDGQNSSEGDTDSFDDFDQWMESSHDDEDRSRFIQDKDLEPKNEALKVKDIEYSCMNESKN